LKPKKKNQNLFFEFEIKGKFSLYSRFKEIRGRSDKYGTLGRIWAISIPGSKRLIHYDEFGISKNQSVYTLEDSE